MFRIGSFYVFPQLVQLGEVSFKSWGEGKTTEVYTLDWSEFDKRIQDRQTTPVITFPEPYESLLRNAQYALPNNYLKEIQHCTEQAHNERNRHKPFDTNIREMCLGPSIKYIETAFRLLCDCLYDPDTNYFWRNPRKNIFANMLLYRFWQHQTGAGCVEDHAAFDKLRSIASGNLDSEEVIWEIRLFLDTFEKQTAANLERIYQRQQALSCNNNHEWEVTQYQGYTATATGSNHIVSMTPPENKIWMLRRKSD